MKICDQPRKKVRRRLIDKHLHARTSNRPASRADLVPEIHQCGGRRRRPVCLGICPATRTLNLLRVTFLTNQTPTP